MDFGLVEVDQCLALQERDREDLEGPPGPRDEMGMNEKSARWKAKGPVM